MIENSRLAGPFFCENSQDSIKNIIIMLHGYGSNGDDLIQLAHELKSDFKNTFFSSPNAPFKFDRFEGGLKWFEVYPDGIPFSEASHKQQEFVKNQFRISCELIQKHIYDLSGRYKIPINNIFLLGFSQGSMMGIEVSLKLKESLAGLVSLSGRVFTEYFTYKTKNNFPIMVIHGDNDEIIPKKRYYETCEILEKLNLTVEKHLIKNMGHTISPKVLEISKNFFKKNSKIH